MCAMVIVTLYGDSLPTLFGHVAPLLENIERLRIAALVQPQGPNIQLEPAAPHAENYRDEAMELPNKQLP